MKIGIPNALFAAYHFPYWQVFLEELGIEVVNSGESCKETVDVGGKLIPHEFCVPVKAFLGHVVNLIEKGADLILVPRMTDRGKRDFFCPKLTGLPEIVRYAAGLEDSRLLTPEIVCRGFDIRMIHYPEQKIKSRWELRRAAQLAGHYWEETLMNCRRKQLTVPEAFQLRDTPPGGKEYNIRLGLLGYAYTLYDPFISKSIIAKLSGMGAKLYTWEMVELDLIEKSLKGLKRPLFWNFGRILLGAGLHFLEDPGIDGIIYATTFGCGPDSIVTKMLNIEACTRSNGSIIPKPFLHITLDEHNEDSHLATRLEAFLDMLAEQKEAQAR